VAAKSRNVKSPESAAYPVSEAALEALLATGGDVAMLTDSAGTIQYVSSAADVTLGHKSEDLIGKNRLQFIPEEERAIVLAAQESIASKPGASVTVSVHWQRPDGTVRDVDCTMKNMLNDTSVGGIVCNCRDTTETNDRTAQLERSRATLKAVLDSSQDAICSVDADHRIITFNATFENIVKAIWGVQLYEGIRLPGHLPADESAFWDDLHAKVLKGESISASRTYHHPNGETLVDFTLYPIVQNNEVIE